MTLVKNKILYQIILGIGIWMIISPIILGAAGTLIFYGNAVAGGILVMLSLEGLLSGGKNI